MVLLDAALTSLSNSSRALRRELSEEAASSAAALSNLFDVEKIGASFRLEGSEVADTFERGLDLDFGTDTNEDNKEPGPSSAVDELELSRTSTGKELVSGRVVGELANTSSSTDLSCGSNEKFSLGSPPNLCFFLGGIL